MNMVSVRAHPKLAFGLLVIAAAVVAGLLWWLIPSSGSDRIDALAIMEDACRQAEAVDSVDITVRGTNTLGDATLKVVEE